MLSSKATNHNLEFDVRHKTFTPAPSRLSRTPVKLAMAVCIAVLLSACGVNNIPTYEEEAAANWSQVQNQYQRRTDLIPNLVETVKGYAAHERQVLAEVVEARAQATSAEIPANLLTDQAQFEQFQQNQNAVSSALSRLLVTVERYPDLKANQNFLALQSQLEGTENRIAVARRDYIEAVRKYNTELKTFPGRWWASFLYPDATPMATFAISEEAATLPSVKFD